MRQWQISVAHSERHVVRVIVDDRVLTPPELGLPDLAKAKSRIAAGNNAADTAAHHHVADLHRPLEACFVGHVSQHHGRDSEVESLQQDLAVADFGRRYRVEPEVRLHRHPVRPPRQHPLAHGGRNPFTHSRL